MAGSPPTSLAASEWSLPVYAIHAGADELLSLAATRQWVDALTQQGTDASLEVFADVTHCETQRFLEPLRAAATTQLASSRAKGGH